MKENKTTQQIERNAEFLDLEKLILIYEYSTQAFCRFTAIPIKLTSGIFPRTGMNNIKFVWKHKI